MKITIPAKESMQCDLCHREERYVQKCITCGRDYCLLCNSLIAGCWVPVNVCRTCGESDEVVKIVLKHAKNITPIIKARNAELSSLLAVSESAPAPARDGGE